MEIYLVPGHDVESVTKGRLLLSSSSLCEIGFDLPMSLVGSYMWLTLVL